MKAVILAAGKGTRLQPLSNYISKAMMPVANIPITQRLVEQIHIETGINEFIILADGRRQDVVRHFSELSKRNGYFREIRIEFAFQREQKGMGHAVKCVLDEKEIEEPFLLLACDSLYPKGEIQKFIQKHESASLEGILALMRIPVESLAKSSSIKIENGIITRIVEKPAADEILSRYASLPLYIFNTELKEYLGSIKPSKRGEFELQDALQAWISDGGKFGFEVMSERDTITSISDLVALNMKYILKAPLLSENLWNRAMVVEPVLSGNKVKVGEGSVIGPNVVIGGSVIIGKDCSIKNSVIFEDSVVFDGAEIENGCWHSDKFFPA